MREINIIDAIEDRRSVRCFTDCEIPDEVLRSIFEAGLYAPSPKNRQPWTYIVISDRAEKKRFTDQMRAEIMKLYSEKPDRRDVLEALDTLAPIEQCSVLMLVCYKNNSIVIHDDGIDWDMAAKDVEALELMSVGASVENMLLKAQSLGVASLWCGDVLYAYQFLKSYSEFPVVSAICFGYAEYVPKRSERKNFKDVFKFIM